MKKILFLEQYAKLSGGQRVLLSIIDGLGSDYNYCVTVPEEGELTQELKKRKITYHILPVGYYALGKKTFLDVILYIVRLPLLIIKLRKIIKQENPDLVYANAARTFIFSTIACSITKTPLIWHVHSIFEGISRKLCNYFGKNKQVKKILVVSEAAKEPLAVLSEKIEIFYNAIDGKVYYPGIKNGLIRKSLDIGDEIVVAMVSLLVEWKCIDDFIKAAAIVVKLHSKVKFTIVGDVLYDDKGKKYKQYLLDLVDDLKIKNNVIFTGFRNDIPEIMREFDIFVLASKQPDPCPTSLLQAMGSGVAVIATDFGGPAEIIKDEEDGLLYKAKDVNGLAEKIRILIEDNNKRKQISENAAFKIKNQYNYENYMNKLKDIIDKQISLETNNIYDSGSYLENNPTWHQEDSRWKSDEAIQVLPKELIEKFKHSKDQINIVDIGCGAGQILKNISEYFNRNNIQAACQGYDLSSDAIEIARRNFKEAEFFNQQFNKDEYFNNKKNISIVLLIDILEHIDKPNSLLEDLSKVSDYVICHLPLEDNLMVNMRGLKNKLKKTVGHINFYNKKAAINLFKQSGFEIENIIYTCSDCSVDYKLESLPRRLILQPIRKLFFWVSPDFTANVLGNCSFMVLLKKTDNK